jgi:hypothetical protein
MAEGICRFTSTHVTRCDPPSYQAGAAEREVVTLLGKPDSVSDRRGPGGKPLTEIRIYEYRIGNWPLWRMDDAFVYVHLDTNDRVVKSEIYGY